MARRGGGEEIGRMGRKTTLVALLFCTFFTVLAALEYRSGGKTTQSVLAWGTQKFLLGGLEEDDDGSGTSKLLLIGGGEGGPGGAAGLEGEPLSDRALVSNQDAEKWRRKKRSIFLDAGKAFVNVLQAPIKTMIKGLKKIFRRGKKTDKKGKQAAVEGGAAPGVDKPKVKTNAQGFLDMDSLTAEELEIVEEVYQALIAILGTEARGAAVRMIIDRECIARYFIAAQWKPAVRGKVMVENVLRTIKWREDEHAHNITVPEVLPQAWNGYLYVQGTDKEGRPLIYFQPAYQNNADPDEAIRYLIYTLERALEISRESGVEAYSFVIDCSGFSLGNMPPVNVIKKTFQMLHHHYPTRVGFIMLLHSGSPFQLLWKVLNPFVSPMTRNKITFAGSGQETKELLARIPVEELEARYGGENGYKFVPHEYFGTEEEEARRMYEESFQASGKKK